MTSTKLVASYNKGLEWSWSGKTLAMVGSGGSPSPEHRHGAIAWISKDDGETWVDETADIVTLGPGIAQWYDKTLYINSMGEGIMRKTLE